MTSETSSAAKSGQESVVLASFDSYRHAEHMLASLGRGFRKKARKRGDTTAVVVRGNPDGSLKVTESRVLSAGDFVSILIRLSLSWTIGFIGLFSMLKGAKGEAHAAHVRKGHVGSDEHRAHRSSAKLARTRPSRWFAARTSTRGSWSSRQRPTAREIAGMAR